MYKLKGDWFCHKCRNVSYEQFNMVDGLHVCRQCVDLGKHTIDVATEKLRHLLQDLLTDAMPHDNVAQLADEPCTGGPVQFALDKAVDGLIETITNEIPYQLDVHNLDGLIVREEDM